MTIAAEEVRAVLVGDEQKEVRTGTAGGSHRCLVNAGAVGEGNSRAGTQDVSAVDLKFVPLWPQV
jgi:hypothetical protein